MNIALGLVLIGAFMVYVVVMAAHFISYFREFESWRGLMDRLTPEQEEMYLRMLNRIAKENMKKKERQ